MRMRGSWPTSNHLFNVLHHTRQYHHAWPSKPCRIITQPDIHTSMQYRGNLTVHYDVRATSPSCVLWLWRWRVTTVFAQAYYPLNPVCFCMILISLLHVGRLYHTRFTSYFYSFPLLNLRASRSPLSRFRSTLRYNWLSLTALMYLTKYKTQID